MEIQGRIWKEGKFWLVEIPSLDVMTQGKTREDAHFMIKDALFELMVSYFRDENLKDFELESIDYGKEVIAITSNNTKLLLAFSLRRLREMSGSTVKEAAERLGSKSPNAYAQYERGTTNITIEKYEELLEAANPARELRLRLV